MKYLLDTNICVFFFRNKFNVADILLKKGYDNCHISEVTVTNVKIANWIKR